MMFTKAIRKIPLRKIAPFSDDDLILFLGKDKAIVLKSIMDEGANNYFSIKNIMESNSVIFGNEDFETRCQKFATITDTRLERFFETDKSGYIFFDKEEQNYIQDILNKNSLSCIIEIYVRNKNSGRFKHVKFEEIKAAEYTMLRRDLSKLNIVATMKPERYRLLNNKKPPKKKVIVKRKKGFTGFILSIFSSNKKQIIEHEAKGNFFNYKDIVAKREKQKLNTILSEYSELNVKTKKDFKSAYKKIVKSLHPDINEGGDERFKKFKKDIDFLKDTQWFRNLPEGSESENG